MQYRLPGDYRDAYVFAILILVLLVRPEGVLGKATVEKSERSGYAFNR